MSNGCECNEDEVGNFMKLSEGNVSEFQKKKASMALTTEFPTLDEKGGMHQIRWNCC